MYPAIAVLVIGNIILIVRCCKKKPENLQEEIVKKDKKDIEKGSVLVEGITAGLEHGTNNEKEDNQEEVFDKT